MRLANKAAFSAMIIAKSAKSVVLIIIDKTEYAELGDLTALTGILKEASAITANTLIISATDGATNVSTNNPVSSIAHRILWTQINTRLEARMLEEAPPSHLKEF